MQCQQDFQIEKPTTDSGTDRKATQEISMDLEQIEKPTTDSGNLYGP